MTSGLKEEITKLYETPMPSTRSGALYNAFSYPTKISAEAIALFIATHTEPGNTVLDVFAGSGSTGLAAKLCDSPTDRMLEMAKKLGLKPKWGPRKAVLYELSVLGSLVSEVMCNPPCPSEFSAIAEDMLKQAESIAGWIWQCEDLNGKNGELRHAIWSEVLQCSKCGNHTTYWEAAVRHNPLELAKSFSCKICNGINQVEGCKRQLEEYFDPILKTKLIRRKRVLARIYGVTDGKNWQRAPVNSDYKLLEKLSMSQLDDTAPLAEIEWGDLYRSGYHQGITHLHHFYTQRNFLALNVLWSLISSYPDKFHKPLKLLILSYNSSHSTLMSRVVVKRNQKDLVLTGSQSGVLYISALPVEKNIFRGIKKKIGSLQRAFSQVWGSSSDVTVYNASSEKLHLKDNSIDYVFTDPPFGDYIPYAEINQINECWLQERTARKSEVIISRGQGKGLSEYENMMSTVFKEISRVMTQNALATVVFHSASSSVWRALTNSYLSGGLAVRTTSILDKVQNSFKQTVSTVSVKGDPIILLSKPCEDMRPDNELFTAEMLVSDLLKNALETNNSEEIKPERLYARYITLSLLKGLNVSIDASEFYKRVGEMFNE